MIRGVFWAMFASGYTVPDLGLGVKLPSSTQVEAVICPAGDVPWMCPVAAFSRRELPAEHGQITFYLRPSKDAPGVTVRPVARSERDDAFDHRRVLRNGVVRYTAERFDRGEFEVDEHVSGQVQLWDGAVFGFTAQHADPWLFWILASLRPL